MLDESATARTVTQRENTRYSLRLVARCYADRSACLISKKSAMHPSALSTALGAIVDAHPISLKVASAYPLPSAQLIDLSVVCAGPRANREKIVPIRVKTGHNAAAATCRLSIRYPLDWFVGCEVGARPSNRLWPRLLSSRAAPSYVLSVAKRRSARARDRGPGA